MRCRAVGVDDGRSRNGIGDLVFIDRQMPGVDIYVHADIDEVWPEPATRDYRCCHAIDDVMAVAGKRNRGPMLLSKPVMRSTCR